MTDDADLQSRLIAAIQRSGDLHEQCSAEVLAADESSQARLLAEWGDRLDAADAAMFDLLAEWAEQRPRPPGLRAVPSPWEYAARYFDPPGTRYDD